VTRGETLSGIAQHFGTTVSALCAANGIKSRSVLRVGQVLVIASSGRAATHVVRAGETVSGIAAAFGTSQKALIALNGLDKDARIFVGQRLRIPGSD
jgi:LysM repeat protein